jgi:ech hydrogenase subunit F
MAYFRMTKLALKWAFQKPATHPYPFAPRQIIPLSRGALTFDVKTCTFCTVCGKKCPTEALAVSRPQRKWEIDRLRCISCGYCVEACPKKALSLSTAHGVPAVTKDHEIYQGEIPPAKPAVAATAMAPKPS